MKKTLDSSAERPVRAADRIRASASELFYREGIRAVGVDEVVDRAGVTKPSLYRSFASKDDLAAAYMRDYELDFWEKFEKPGGKPYSDARKHVLAYIRWLSARALRKGSRARRRPAVAHRGHLRHRPAVGRGAGGVGGHGGEAVDRCERAEDVR